MDYEKMIFTRTSSVLTKGRWVNGPDEKVEVAVLAIVGKWAMVRFAKGAMPHVVSARDLSPINQLRPESAVGHKPAPLPEAPRAASKIGEGDFGNL